MDFFDNGFACLELLDSKFASDAWKDVDKNEYRTLLETTSESQSPWKSLTSPTTQSFGDFVLEVDKVGNCSLSYISWMLTGGTEYVQVLGALRKETREAKAGRATSPYVHEDKGSC